MSYLTWTATDFGTVSARPRNGFGGCISNTYTHRHIYLPAYLHMINIIKIVRGNKVDTHCYIIYYIVLSTHSRAVIVRSTMWEMT